MKKYLLLIELVALLAIIIVLFTKNESNLFGQNYLEAMKFKGVSLVLNTTMLVWGCYFIFITYNSEPSTKIILIFALTIIVNLWFGVYYQSFGYLNFILVVGILELMMNNRVLSKS